MTLVTMATTNEYDVVIVGAGFAGLGWCLCINIYYF